MYKKNVFCILGPSGIGKSYISIELCNLLPIEIISVDSSLIYKYLNIGTAKPSKDELKKYSHKLISIIDPKEYYSVNNFFYDAKNEINIIYNNNNIPLLVGGTMMYYNVLFNGLYNLPKSNLNIRNYINLLFKNYGKKYIYNLFKKIDLSSFQKIHYNDKYRMIRNLEIYFITGKNITYLKKKKKKKLDCIFHKIIILPYNKNNLFNSIKNRFYKMLKLGFKEEVLFLYNRGDLNIKMPSIKSIGYKQMWLYFQNKISYNEMINYTINSNIFLIKKQITWLKKWLDSYIIVLDNYSNCIKKIYNYINKFI